METQRDQMDGRGMRCLYRYYKVNEEIRYFKEIRNQGSVLRTFKLPRSIQRSIQKHDIGVINRIILESAIRFKIHKAKLIWKKI